jgi:exonuclease SbcC
VGELAPVSANGLDAAVMHCEAARKAELASRETAKLAVARATSATATAQTASGRIEELSAQRLGLAASLDEALPDEEDVSLAGIVGALNQQVEARSERRALEGQVKDIAEKLDRLTSDMSQARQKLAVLKQRRDAAQRDLERSQEALSDACGRLMALASECGWRDVAAAVEAGRDVTQGLKTRQASTQAEHQQTLQVIGQSEERLTRLRADMDRAKSLHKELEGLKKEHGVAADLALMLQANKFQDFMQAEALQTLAKDGSRRLEELSSGRYRLQIEDKGRDFEVIDKWNAEQVRSVKTLSGGETFLASLALALALAESLPGLAASRRVVLDSIFLDEGFGSLDAEALDRAADALDRLRDENRLVCVVTHLSELAQRLPARVVVTKSETGSSVAVE